MSLRGRVIPGKMDQAEDRPTVMVGCWGRRRRPGRRTENAFDELPLSDVKLEKSPSSGKEAREVARGNELRRGTRPQEHSTNLLTARGTPGRSADPHHSTRATGMIPVSTTIRTQNTPTIR